MEGQRDILLTISKTLRKYSISYFLSGSFASSYYGYPRATHDIDLIVEVQPQTAAIMARALKELKKFFLIDFVSIPEAIVQKSQFDIFHPNTGIKVDFWISPGTPFAVSCFRRKRVIKLDKQNVSIISSEDLILAKLLWYREGQSERQLRDCAGIWKIQEGKLELSYLKHWAKELNLSELLNKLPTIEY